MKKTLTRRQSAKAIIDFYDDLTNTEIRKLPAVERDLYYAALDFQHAKTITKRKPAPRRTARKISRKPKAVVKPERGAGRGKTRRREKPIPRRKKKTLVDEYPELDALDNLEEMIQDVLESEGERYHSQ
jgi:hypothetical protein